MSAALPRTAPTAEPAKDNTPANEQGNGCIGRQFPNEIGARADGVVGLTDLLPTLAGGAANGAASSFPSPKGRRGRRGKPLLLGRLCAHCGTELTRKEGEGPTDFNQRRFCGNSCSFAARSSAPIPPKDCGFCEQQMFARPGENAGKFLRRVYCSPVCCNKAVGRKVSQANAALRALNESDRGRGRSFPKPGDKGCEAEIYAGERYDAPGRTVILDSSTHRLDARPPTHVFAQSSLGAISR
jgi:hypothetical protein